MKERQKRLIEVYDYLRLNSGIHTKSGFAEALGYGRTSLSAAMNGKEVYLTDSLFKSICQRWPDIFNLKYLLDGSGSLLLNGGVNRRQLSAQDVEKMEARHEVVEYDSLQTDYVNMALMAKDETIQAMKDQLATKDELIQAKDALIEALRSQIATMRSGDGGNRFDDYPFEMGVAESRPEYK